MIKHHTDAETVAIVQRIQQAVNSAEHAIPRVWPHDWGTAAVYLSKAKRDLELAIGDINEIRDREDAQ